MPRSEEQMVLYSGECSFKFKFRLIGIERINVLFKELEEFVATENKDTKPRNVQLDNNKAVKVLPKDDSKLQKVTAWLKNKLGLAQARGEDELLPSNVILPPCITQSIQEHESAPPILKYEEALERQATSGNFDLNLQQVLTLGLTDGKQDGGKKSRSKSKNKKD